jgi:rubrerythrin
MDMIQQIESKRKEVFYKTLQEVKSTAENLDTAISGETFEYKKMYPDYLNVANKDKNNGAAWSFKVANQVEQIHAGLFSNAAKTVKTGKDLPKVDYYICSVCGNTVENEPPEKCPICGTPKSKFFKAT